MFNFCVWTHFMDSDGNSNRFFLKSSLKYVQTEKPPGYRRGDGRSDSFIQLVFYRDDCGPVLFN